MVGYKTIATAGACQRLQEHSQPVSGVIITAKLRNVGVLFFSIGSGASALEQTEAGIDRYGGERLELRGPIDLKDIWVAAQTAGDGAYWFAWK